MKKILLTTSALAIALSVTSSALAVSYNVVDTAIFGSGNPDTGWTVDSGGGALLGLRGKNRTTGDTANVNGVYNVPTGFAAVNRGFGNVEWSVDTGNQSLIASGYQFWLAYDTDPSAGTSFSYLNLALVPDNYYGSDSTANGGGVVGLYAASGLFNSEAQNSLNQYHAGVNPLIDGSYRYDLFATAGLDALGARTASVGVTINVGAGAPAVPDKGNTMLLSGLSIGGLLLARRKMAVA